MFILTLRGPFGIKMMMAFLLLIFFSGLSLYLINNPVLEALICTAAFISYVLMIRYLRKYRDLLEFNGPGRSVYTFPNTRKAKKVLFYFHLFIAVGALPAPLAVLVADIPLGAPNFSDFRVIAGIISFYFGGNLALVGIINNAIHNRERGLGDA